MRKIVSILSIVIVGVTVLMFYSFRVGGESFGVSFPCACVTSDVIVSMDKDTIEKEVNEFHEEFGRYPEFNELEDLIHQKNEIGEIEIYSELKRFYPFAGKSEGVYYRVSWSGDEYTIEGYAWGSWNGIPVIANVDSKDNGVEYDFR